MEILGEKNRNQIVYGWYTRVQYVDWVRKIKTTTYTDTGAFSSLSSVYYAKFGLDSKHQHSRLDIHSIGV